MPAEQLMERVADDVESTQVSAKTLPMSDSTSITGRDDGADATYSPDPERRTDRYRLVTPYLLRI